MSDDRILYPAGIDTLTGKPVAAPVLEEIAKRFREKLEELFSRLVEGKASS